MKMTEQEKYYIKGVPLEKIRRNFERINRGVPEQFDGTLYRCRSLFEDVQTSDSSTVLNGYEEVFQPLSQKDCMSLFAFGLSDLRFGSVLLRISS